MSETAIQYKVVQEKNNTKYCTKHNPIIYHISLEPQFEQDDKQPFFHLEMIV